MGNQKELKGAEYRMDWILNKRIRSVDRVMRYP